MNDEPLVPHPTAPIPNRRDPETRASAKQRERLHATGRALSLSARLRALVTSLIALSLLAISLPGTAAAEPLTTSVSVPAMYKHKASVSKSQFAALKIAKKVADTASKGRVLNYKKASTLWGKHKTYRRQFAGAWVAGGGKLTNISRSERANVYRYRLKGRTARAASMSALGGTNCTGDTAYFGGFVRGNNTLNYYFYDSCRTNDIKANLTFCMTGAGFTAVILRNQGVAVLMAALIAGCGSAGNWISKAQNNSRKNAIVIRVTRGYDYSKNRYIAPVEIVPQ